MIANQNFEHCQPLTWVGRVPVYLATVLAGVQVVAMILTALAMAVAGPMVQTNPILAPLVFSFASVKEGWSVWQYFTYAFVNPPSLFFVFQVFMFAWFGRDVEQFLGRRSFAWLYGALIVAMPVLLSALSFFGVSWPYFGSGPVHFAVFLAFAMIYPRAQIFFGMEARWIALVLMAIFSLQFLAANSWPELAILWWGCSVAALWLRFEGVSNLQFSGVSAFLRRKDSERKLRVVRKQADPSPEPEVHDSIDPILEKIARQGIGSLTRGEREKLERARTALLEKERRN
jgi:hypothetical protein